jgi:hypothetical protein
MFLGIGRKFYSFYHSFKQVWLLHNANYLTCRYISVSQSEPWIVLLSNT